jgi:hypothetical protein
MRRLPNSRVIHMQIVADRPDHDFTRIEPHPDLDLDLVCLADLVGVRPDRLLHGQGRIARPDGMIFMGNGCPEQGHDPIAHDLVHGPFIAMDGCHQAFQHRIEELAGLLRITVSQDFHGAFEVGKEHRHLLALTFQGTTGGEDFLGEIGRGVGEGWRLVGSGLG